MDTIEPKSTSESEADLLVGNDTKKEIAEEKPSKSNETNKNGDIGDCIKENLGNKVSNFGDIAKQVNIGRADNVSIDNSVTHNYYVYNGDDGKIRKVEKEETITIASEDAKSYKLYERQDCSDFVAEYETSLHLAYAIAISMFEYVPVGNLQRLSESLLRRFPKTLDAEGREIRKHISPFLSLDAILAVIGAQTCKVSFETRFENLTERCVCFNECSDKIMENLWDLFPMLRSEIISWLIESDFVGSFRNDLNTFCYVKAMANIVKLDFGDSISRLFPQLASNEHNKYLMIRLMLALINEEETRTNICEILRQWSTSPKWLWEISLVVYAFADEEPTYSRDLERTLKSKLLYGFDKDWRDWNIRFISGQMVGSLRLRNLISGMLQKIATAEKRGKNEYMVSIIYLLITSSAYQFVNKDDMALPLVAVDNKKQIENIELLLYKIFSDFMLRQSLFEALEVYLKELNGYKASEQLEKQLISYFYVIGKKSQRYLGDVQRFLKRLQSQDNKLAEKISVFLQEKFESKELTTI